VVEQAHAVHAFARKLQQDVRAVDVRLDEVVGLDDGPVDVRLGGEVADRVDRVLVVHLRHCRAVADVGADEDIARAVLLRHVGEALRVAGIGELVDVDDAPGEARLLEEVAHEVAADEPAAAGHQEIVHGR
jgi:hypothetical protein